VPFRIDSCSAVSYEPNQREARAAIAARPSRLNRPARDVARGRLLRSRVPKRPTKFAVLHRHKGSPFWYAHLTLPPTVRRSFDPSGQPQLASILSFAQPDRHNRVRVSLKTANKRYAEQLRSDIETMVRKAWDASLKRELFNQLTGASGARLVSITDLFADVSHEEEKRVAVGHAASNPIEAQKRGALTPETAARWRSHRKLFTNWLNADFPGKAMLVSDVTSTMLGRFKTWMRARYTVGTYNHVKNYLSGIWTVAISKDYCDRNPWQAKELSARKDPKRVWPVLTEEDRHLVLGADKTWPVNGLIVMMFTGARSSDLVWLQRSHVDFVTGDLTLFQSKTAKYVKLDGVLKLLPDLAAALKRQLASHDSLFVFPNSTGTKNTRQYLNKEFNRALKNIVGNHVSAHTFRRSAATLMDEAGVPLPVIRDYLGHATVEQTLLYIQRRKEGVAQAAEKLQTKRQMNLL
jgi:integrase